MFSLVFVCPRGGEGGYAWSQVPFGVGMSRRVGMSGEGVGMSRAGVCNYVYPPHPKTWDLGYPPPPKKVNPRKVHPLVLTFSGGHRSGRYASYWNAFLFKLPWSKFYRVFILNYACFKIVQARDQICY